MADRQSRSRNSPNVRVVSHHPYRQALLILLVIVVCASGALGGFWLGRNTGELDGSYVVSLERLNEANTQSIERLQAELVAADLSLEVDREAAVALKESIRELKDEVASLTEEVNFYKSLMAPSSVARGLQIADFELLAMERPDQFTFHLLLTQVESRRDWVQGSATLEVHGRHRAAGPLTGGSELATVAAEQVLELTEIAADGTYPLKFRFRYFQDLTGVITLPSGFEPERIVVKAGKGGSSVEALSRTFEWTVAG